MEIISTKRKKEIINVSTKELISLIISDCKTTGDIHAKLNQLFAGTVETNIGSRNGRTSRL